MNAGLPRSGDLLRIREARWHVVRCTAYDDAAVVEVRGCGRENADVRTRFLWPFEAMEPWPAPAAPVIVPPRRWRKQVRWMLGSVTETYAALATPARALLSVLPFQLEPALAVTHGLSQRLLIADAVGLGKTVQAALVIAETLHRYPDNGRALIVCPAGLREQWQQELRARFSLDASVLESATLGQTSADAATSPWAACAIVITSIDYVKRPEVMRALEGLVWDVAVFDEVHALAGRSDRHAAAAALAARARTVVMLTATPHSGDDEAFARLAAVGDIGGRFPLCVFRRTRLDAGLPLGRRTHWLRVRPTSAERRMHDVLLAYTRRVWTAGTPGARLAMAVLSRRACSSAASLARSVERRLALLGPLLHDDVQLAFSFLAAEDEEPIADLAVPGLPDREEERRLLETLLELARKAAVHESKLRCLAVLLRRTAEPAIVFTEYRDTLERLQTALAGRRTVLLHGGMSSAERRQTLRQFTSGEAVLLLATDAASEGLNLHQRCRLIVNLELPWTPLRLEQRIGRVDRIGQARRVHAVHLVAAGTAEETTVATLCHRQQHADLALRAIGDTAPDDVVMRAIVEGHDGARPVSGTAHRREGNPSKAWRGDGVHSVDLRSEAEAEALRIAGARRLVTGGSVEASVRPPIALVRRHSASGAIWAFRLGYADQRGRIVFESLLGLHAADLSTVPRSPAALRQWLDGALPRLARLVQPEHERGRRVLERELERLLARVLEREQAILDTLRHEYARMASRLLQPGLFDHRSGREALAQRQVVDEAVARVRTRLVELAACRQIAAADRTLAFAVVLA